MKKQNFFEDPEGVLQEIQRQRQLQQEQQLAQQQQRQQCAQQIQFISQQTHPLSTFTASTSMMATPPSSSTATTISTAPSPLACPLNSELQQQPPAVSTCRPKPGILRLDINKPRRSSGGSVECRNQPHMHGAAVSFLC